MKGAKPIPTTMKLLAGNPGKRPLNDAEPQYELSTPTPPEELSAQALKEWERLCLMLAEAGVLTDADVPALQVYISHYDRWLEAEKSIKREGSVIKTPFGPKTNPWLKISREATASMLKILVEFGMTPSSRTRIKTGPKKELEPDDREEKLFA